MNRRVLFVHQNLSSFVEKDLRILRKEYIVDEFCYSSIFDVIKLCRDIPKNDIVFCWFGKLHAFFAVVFCKIFRKKSIVVSGGDDVVYDPKNKYGMFSFWWKKWCPLFVYKYCDLILCVSKYNMHETLENAKANRNKINLIYHGFDLDKFKPIPGVKKEKIAITVGGIDWQRVERKGYERFVQSARYLPDVQFILVGAIHDSSGAYLKKNSTQNVTLTGPVSDSELLELLSRAKVYVQISVHEAFGCSLAEAMACQCVPVVSRKAAIPEVVGECGFYVDNFEPEEIARKIKEGLESDLGEKARNRIKSVFPLSKREDEILKAIAKISME